MDGDVLTQRILERPQRETRVIPTSTVVEAVDPHATEVEGDPCWPDLGSIPDGVDAVGGCPLMFGPTADGPHKVLCRIFTWAGKVPRHV